MSRPTDKDMLFIAKALKENLDMLTAGAHLVGRTGYTVDQLREKAVRDRLEMARLLLGEARLAASAVKPAYRTAVSRAYYAMYHAFRAVCFYIHNGDDYEKHDKLPSAIPRDFPACSQWENDLKRARYDRNRADYDPYPRSSRTFEATARDLLITASSSLAEAKDYLRAKGCKL